MPKATMLDFIAFSAFTQQISVPEWSFLTKQGTFVIVRCLHAWCALMENSEDYKEDDGEMIQLDVEAANLPSSPTIEAQYSHKWKLMATLKKRILAIRSKMAKQSDKVYHENGLCYFFSCVYGKMINGEPNNINNKDVQYPASEEVELQEVFSMFKKLQIQGEVIDLNDRGDNKAFNNSKINEPKSKPHIFL